MEDPDDFISLIGVITICVFLAGVCAKYVSDKINKE